MMIGFYVVLFVICCIAAFFRLRYAIKVRDGLKDENITGIYVDKLSQEAKDKYLVSLRKNEFAKEIFKSVFLLFCFSMICLSSATGYRELLWYGLVIAIFATIPMFYLSYVGQQLRKKMRKLYKTSN